VHRIIEPEVATQALMGADSSGQLGRLRTGLGESEEHSGIGEEVPIGRTVLGSMRPLRAVVKSQDVACECGCQRIHVHLTWIRQ